MHIINQTPYAMERVVIFDRAGNETLIVIVKGTLDFAPGQTSVAEQQSPINVADEYYGDPVSTSISVPTDLLPTRPTTGVTLQGSAIAANGATKRMPVGIRVGTVQQKAMVFGDRTGFHNISNPEPFERMPLTWENAFGGFDQSHDNQKHHDALELNPVGKGFQARRSKLDPDVMRLPNVENPGEAIRSPQDRIAPVGFGPIPPFWVQRRHYAGTYDDQWVKERSPLLPDDFDDRFLQAAPQALTSDSYMKGDEQVAIIGMTDEGRVDFSLDAPEPVVGIRFARKGIRSHPKLESIHFNTDTRQVHLTWKSSVNIQGRVEELKNIEARLR
jgi:hypothetical protein